MQDDLPIENEMYFGMSQKEFLSQSSHREFMRSQVDQMISGKGVPVPRDNEFTLQEGYCCEFQGQHLKVWPKWYTTEEKMPEEGENVLVDCDYGIMISYWEDFGIEEPYIAWWQAEGDGRLKISHWTYLPKPPMEKE